MNHDWYERQRTLIIKFQKENDNKAIFALLHDYEGLIVKLSGIMIKKFRSSPLTFDDYFQCLTFSFIERTKKYNFNSRMNYSSYIEKFLTLDVNNYAKKYLTINHKLMNYSNLINYEDSNKYFYEEMINFSFEDLNISSLKRPQQFFLKILLENGGDVKKTAEELKIPLKTVYRHRKEIIEKLHKNNKIN